VTTRVLIADDEAPARRIVRSYLVERSDAEVIGEVENGLEVVDAVRALEPDLVVLDVQMPGLNGFEAIDAVGFDSMPAVIFATAYDEFALKAFEVHAVDYLLKPFSRERFDRAFERALERAGRGDIARLLASLPHATAYLERVVVRHAERLFFVATSEVTQFSAEGNYVRVYTSDASHLIRGTLAAFESRLDPARFARVHRSAIVNIESIKEVQTHFHGDYVIVLKTGDTLRLSRRYADRLLSGS
jgi:two-component system LytT family response regulator